jgi:hypothetical protein
MITLDISDVEMESALAQFRDFSTKAKNEIAFAAVFEAAQPMAEAERALAPAQEGGLKQSIGVAMRKKKTRTYAVIGPRWGYGKEGEEPARYGHLVEYGHRIAHGKSGKLDRKTINTSSPNGYVPAHPFMRPAWEATKEKVYSTLQTVLRREITAWAARKKKK